MTSIPLAFCMFAIAVVPPTAQRKGESRFVSRLFRGAPPYSEVTLTLNLVEKISSFKGCYIRLLEGTDQFYWDDGVRTLLSLSPFFTPLGKDVQTTLGVFCADGTLFKYEVR